MPDFSRSAIKHELAARRQQRAASAARSAERHRAGTELLNALKDRPCADCGGEFHPAAMDFDHVRGEKLFHIDAGRMRSALLLDELAKCELRCANCHRTRHALERS